MKRHDSKFKIGPATITDPIIRPIAADTWSYLFKNSAAS